MRRRGVRQDGGGRPGCLQGGGRFQAGGRSGTHDHSVPAALPYLFGAAAGSACAGGEPEPREERQGSETDTRGAGGRQDRHPYRDAQDTRQGYPVPRPRTAHHRRGAEVRRVEQGEVAPDERTCGYADAHGDAHSADAAVFADGCTRPLRNRHPTAQPPAYRHGVAPFRRGDYPRSGRGGAGTPRTGLLRPQPGGQYRADCRPHPSSLSQSEGGDRPRTDARAAARKTRHGLHLRRVRRAGGHDHHRERRRYSQRQYHHHQRRPEFRPQRFAPTARPRGAFRQEGVLLSPDSSRRAAYFRCPAQDTGRGGVFGPRGRIQHRHAGPRYTRSRQSARSRTERFYRRYGVRNLSEDIGRSGRRASGRRRCGSRRIAGGRPGARRNGTVPHRCADRDRHRGFAPGRLHRPECRKAAPVPRTGQYERRAADAPF